MPKPTVPPKYQPDITAEISKVARIKAIGSCVFFVRPVINPSLGPGPKFAIKYMPLPKPTSKTENTARIYFEKVVKGGSKRKSVKSIIAAIIKIFKIVPIPGFCFSGNQKPKTTMLIMNVDRPIEIFNMFDNPSARTDHGELPVVETNKRPSPKPNKVNPTHKSIKVVNLGFKFKGFSELQDFEGIFLMVKNIIL